MLRRLQLENFKAWKKADMRLAPLTGLFGTNSSGKTSILQFLLMLKQTVESSDRALVLNLNGNYVELGTFKDVLLDHDITKKLSFLINYSFRKVGLDLNDETYYYNHPSDFGCRIMVKSNSPTLDYFFYKDNEDTNEVYRDIKGNLKLKMTGVEQKYIDDYNKNNLKPISFFGFPQRLPGTFYEHEAGLEDFFREIMYLGPLREYPKRFYQWGGERRSQLGNRGEYAIECILASREHGDIIEHEGETFSLETYLAMWLRQLGMIQDFKIDSITEGGRLFEVRVRQTEKSPYVLLTDVGFGVSQILPVLTLCYYTPKGSILLMEQPEIHLHPRVQAGLADVFIDAIKKRGVQIILESHSEHLLRRLQLRIAQEKFSSDDAALYFCEIKEGYSELCDLQLDEFGNIKNWPDNFFGDEMTEVFQMTEAIAERKKKAKLNGK